MLARYNKHWWVQSKIIFTFSLCEDILIFATVAFDFSMEKEIIVQKFYVTPQTNQNFGYHQDFDSSYKNIK